MANLVTIKAASSASGLPVDTIRYYERVGVLPSVSRGANRYRAYTQEHLETLRFARALRDLGLPLGEMSALIRVFHDGTCREMQQALAASAREALEGVIRQRMQLEQVEEQLRSVLQEVVAVAPDEQRNSGLAPCPWVVIVEGQ